jgi:hypothetical protein
MRASYVEQYLSRGLIPKWQPDLQQSVFLGCHHDTGGDQFLESQAVADFLQDLPAMPSQRRSFEQREQCNGVRENFAEVPTFRTSPTPACFELRSAPILEER